ncbi:MAG: hypothetical protein ACRD0B_00500 [Acidimicrobiales bacterium]
MTRPRVYAAHPQASYGAERERGCLSALAELLPQCELYDPSGRYLTDAAWLRAWPRVVRTLSGLIVFGDEDGSIGVGCLREIADCERYYLPVAMLDAECRPRVLAGLRFLPDSSRSPRRVAYLVAGRRVNLARHLGLDEAAP